MVDKVPDVLKAIRECLDVDSVFDTRHATDRKSERSITWNEIMMVLRSGFHERRKDKWEKLYQAWNYSIRGKTTEGRSLRVVVSFNESGALIITAIDFT